MELIFQNDDMIIENSNNMKKSVFLYLSILMLCVFSCNKDPDPDIQGYYTTAIVGYNSNLRVVTLITPLGTFLAPQLNEHHIFILNDGDALWTYIVVNWDEQPIEGQTVVEEVVYSLLEKVVPQEVVGGVDLTDYFDAPIEKIDPLVLLIDKSFNNYVAFFIFTHTVHGSTKYIYQMTYDPDEDSEIITVYFKAKEHDTGVLPMYAFQYFYAFDLKDFLWERRDSENKVSINIMYYTGTDFGEDIYEPWSGNPIALDFE